MITRRACVSTSFIATMIAATLAQGRGAPERLSAIAIVGPDHQSSRPVEIVINESSTNVEASAFVTIFDLKGADAVLNALRASRALGTLRAPDGHVHQLRYVRETRLASGARHLLLLVEPPLDVADILTGGPTAPTGQMRRLSPWQCGSVLTAKVKASSPPATKSEKTRKRLNWASTTEAHTYCSRRSTHSNGSLKRSTFIYDRIFFLRKPDAAISPVHSHSLASR